jgi:anti-sigma-K factor RskA
MAHESYKELLPLHALSALDGTDAQSVEQHLSSCAECRAEFEQWQSTASEVANAAATAEPSPELRSRIIDAVRGEAHGKARSNVVSISRPRSSNWAWQAIAAAIIVGLIIGLVVLWRQTQRLQKETAQLSERLQETSARLDHQRAVLDVLSAPGARMAELAGTKDAPSAHAMLAVDSKTRRAVFMARGLPQPPAGKAYQLWFISGVNKMPGSVFKTDSAGNAMMMSDQIPSDALAANVFAVTLESQDGVTSPTGPMILLSL